MRQYNLKLTKAAKMLEKDSLYLTSTEMMHKIFPHYLYWCLDERWAADLVEVQNVGKYNSGNSCQCLFKICMYHYFMSFNSSRYLNILPAFVKGYNV